MRRSTWNTDSRGLEGLRHLRYWSEQGAPERAAACIELM
jgi:hypothetical protein